MAYIFIAIHYPQPEHREDLIRSMRKMGQTMAAQPGLIEAGPWVEQSGDRVLGVSRWQSREAFLAAMPGSGVPNTRVHEFETRPREYLHLEEPL
jgi:quinol monooxygenase YgiN